MDKRKNIIISAKAYNAIMELKKAKENEGAPTSILQLVSSIILRESERAKTEG